MSANTLTIIAIAAICLCALWAIFDGESLVGVIISAIFAIGCLIWLAASFSLSHEGRSISINADNWTCTRSKIVLMQIVVGKTAQLMPRDICTQYSAKAQ